MANSEIIRGWKDEDLDEAQKERLPQNPVDDVDLLSDDELDDVNGGTSLSCAWNSCNKPDNAAV